MGISITKRPIQLVNGHQSKWMPVHQPITFEIQRVDSVVSNIKYIFSGGVPVQLQLSTTTNLNILKVKAGQKIQVFNGVNSKTFDIISTTANDIFIKYDNLPTFGSPIIFLGISHYIETAVYYLDASQVPKLIGNIKNKTNTEGVAQVSIQELIATKTANENLFLYNQINKSEIGEGSRFFFSMTEYYNGLFYDVSIPLSNFNGLYYTNSANQIQNKYGYNMGDYVPTYDAGRTDKAKFQSVFARPTYFPSYPFSLNFIYSDNLENFDVYRIEDQKDINGTIITSSADILNISHRELANRLMLAGSYTSNVRYVDVWLDTDGEPSIYPPYMGSIGSPYVEVEYIQPYTVHNVVVINNY